MHSATGSAARGCVSFRIPPFDHFLLSHFLHLLEAAILHLFCTLYIAGLFPENIV
jgi:hypothetical protein